MAILLLLAFAAFCCAVRDTISHHWHSSVLRLYWPITTKTGFWLSPESWKLKYVNYPFDQRRIKWKVLGIVFNKPLVFTDAWHLLKTLEITAYILAIVLHNPLTDHILLNILIYGSVWNIVFNIWYSEILINKRA